MQPNCKMCPKWISYDGKGKDTRSWEKSRISVFTNREQYVYNAFKCAKSFKILPREGGYDAQDPGLIDVMLLLDAIVDNLDEKKEMALRKAMIESRVGI